MLAIETHQLRKEYGGLVAVRNLTIEVSPGMAVGLIGPNGSGKTTLLKMLATLLPPTYGSISLFGMDSQQDFLKIRERIGYLPDFFNLYPDLTIREALRFMAEAYGIARGDIPAGIEETLEMIDLLEKGDDFIEHLSRGMVQRLGLGTLLVRRPALYLLDEPASGLDPASRVQVRNVLKRMREAGYTIFISSHILSELAELCTHFLILEKGKAVFWGSQEQLQNRNAARCRLRIRLLDRIHEAAEWIRQQPGAALLEQIDSTLVVETGSGLEEQAELNAALMRQGFRVASFAEEKTGIEEMYLQTLEQAKPQ